jgi:signal transduction histidine kinase
MLTSILEVGVLSRVGARFTAGWYAGRLLGIVTSTLVLAILVRETAVLYGRMARSNAMLLRERNNRLLTVEALLGSIRHEMGQPLAAAALDAETVGVLLKAVPPQLDEARAVTAGITAGIHRGIEMLDDIRNLFGTARREAGPIDMNDVTLEALRNLDKELRTHKVATRVELASELPPVVGLRGQLQEVIVNLIQNAIDAMQTVGDRRHELQVKTAHNGDDAIKVTITDTGPGIDTSKSGQMFEAFFTTKPHGMGLGLAICRMIIERHGGQISVLPASPHGATFEIILPRLTPLP